MNERGSTVVKHIREDEDQGPSKEWGEYGWYHFPAKEDISKRVENRQYCYLLRFQFSDMLILNVGEAYFLTITV